MDWLETQLGLIEKTGLRIICKRRWESRVTNPADLSLLILTKASGLSLMARSAAFAAECQA